MPLLTGNDGTVVTAAWTSEATQKMPLGFRAHDSFNREFLYVKAGAADLVVGNAIQSPAQITNHQQLTPSVAALGANQIIVTPTATSIAANDYADGIAVIDTTPGVGYAYKIGSHAAWVSGLMTLNLVPEDAIVVALTAVSRVSLTKSPYSAVIQAPVTTPTGIPLGGCIFIITTLQYGWIQAHGLGAALIAGTPAVGQPVTQQGAVAGALSVHSAELTEVALMQVTGVDTKVQAVFWLL